MPRNSPASRSRGVWGRWVLKGPECESGERDGVRTPKGSVWVEPCGGAVSHLKCEALIQSPEPGTKSESQETYNPLNVQHGHSSSSALSEGPM